MDVRIVAILVGVAITFTIQNGLDARWYISVPRGIVGYVIARLIGWAINERMRRKRAEAERPIREIAESRAATGAGDSSGSFRRQSGHPNLIA